MSPFECTVKAFCSSLLLTSLLCACAPSAGELVPGKSSLPQVLAQMGQPSMVWSGGGGALLMEFARVPPGHENFMAQIGSDGVLISLRQVLTEESAASLHGGMTSAQVRQILGRPARVDPPAHTNAGETWHWPLDQSSPPMHQLDVQFGASGTILSIGRSSLPPGTHS